MFGIGFAELIVILAVALIVIGPDKLPEMAKTLAKAYNELRRAGDEVKKSLKEANMEERSTHVAQRPHHDESGTVRDKTPDS
ncbi:MAG: twin-arginine translocase subunit TatB [Deltaproteobacteria bacterium]|nr:twin-arginine translocase subunit TatB [Deltaproteobacteria bacterium]